MLSRKVLLLVSLFVLLVEADFDPNDTGVPAMVTDKDSTSDEALTAPAANQVTAPDPANSVEEDDEKSDSDEGGKKKIRAKPQILAVTPRAPAPTSESPAHNNRSPTLPPQPIIPQPKAAVRNRSSKRRSRTNRRQI